VGGPLLVGGLEALASPLQLPCCGKSPVNGAEDNFAAPLTCSGPLPLAELSAFSPLDTKKGKTHTV